MNKILRLIYECFEWDGEDLVIQLQDHCGECNRDTYLDLEETKQLRDFLNSLDLETNNQ